MDVEQNGNPSLSYQNKDHERLVQKYDRRFNRFNHKSSKKMYRKIIITIPLSYYSTPKRFSWF